MSDSRQPDRTEIERTQRLLGERFELQAELGFLFKAMSGTVEAEIARKLDALLAKATG